MEVIQDKKNSNKVFKNKNVRDEMEVLIEKEMMRKAD